MRSQARTAKPSWTQPKTKKQTTKKVLIGYRGPMGHHESKNHAGGISQAATHQLGDPLKNNGLELKNIYVSPGDLADPPTPDWWGTLPFSTTIDLCLPLHHRECHMMANSLVSTSANTATWLASSSWQSPFCVQVEVWAGSLVSTLERVDWLCRTADARKITQ